MNLRCLAAISLVAASLLPLAGCNAFDRRTGPAPVLDAAAVASASANTTLILQALAVDAGQDPGGPVDWYRVSEAGFNYVDDQCRSYFDELFFLDRAKDRTKSGLAAAGQTTAAILGLTGASSVSLAIAAQAFGLSISGTELLAGTYLYRLPPATTQGFVQRMQQAFRDAAAASRRRIDSPTIAYHVVQRYLDLCLPPRIEAEVVRQLNAATAIPVPQGPGSLFSIETVSSPPPAALRPFSFVEPEFRAATVARADRPMTDRRRSPEDREKRTAQVGSLSLMAVQRALCVPATGTADAITTDAARTYLRARTGTPPARVDLMSPAVRPTLEAAVTDVGDCAAAGYRTAYEVGRFGVPSEGAAERIRRMQADLDGSLKRKGSGLAVARTGRFDAQTRAAIAAYRGLTGRSGDAIDPPLDSELQQ